ncbi:MAG: dihydroxyacetone kinase subunit L [Elusimicrobiota bacterium]|jgi:dihydroxyacetone kinase-like protein|nr:dihydroxyacetone kinase subunit L [Elusimicrobiota bacterium]
MINLSNVKELAVQLNKIYTEQKAYLSQLDSDIGDGDHGVNMARGFNAVVEALEKTPPKDIGEAFKSISMSLIKTVGGASGPLYGTFFLKAALVFAKKTQGGIDEWIEALDKAIAGIQQIGKAQKGDKTMLDIWFPALDSLKASKAAGKSFDDCLKDSSDAAQEAMKATIPLLAKKGRASYLGERSIGHQDPGATSAAMLLKAVSEIFVK